MKISNFRLAFTTNGVIFMKEPQQKELKKMAKLISVLLDDEQENLLEYLLQARREKNVSRIIREALWCYGEKILPKTTTAVVKEAEPETEIEHQNMEEKQ